MVFGNYGFEEEISEICTNVYYRIYEGKLSKYNETKNDVSESIYEYVREIVCEIDSMIIDQIYDDLESGYWLEKIGKNE